MTRDVEESEEKPPEEAVLEQASELTAQMLQKHLYVVLTTPLKPMSELVPVLPDHLNYITDLEKRGILFASGPFLRGEQVKPGSGMTILRAASMEEAEAIAERDPFASIGLRAFEIREWQLDEGRYSVTVDYSDQHYRIE